MRNANTLIIDGESHGQRAKQWQSSTMSGDNQSENTKPDEALPNNQKLPKIIRFEDLARCGEEIWIENHGQIYRLRRTRQGKLILTK